MLRYAAEIYDAYHLPVYQLVIYLGNRPLAMADGISYRLSDANRLNYRYRLVDIGSIGYNEIKDARHPHFLALLPLADREKRKVNPIGFLDRCAREIVETDQLDVEGKRKTILRAEIFAGLAFEEEAINQIFREVDEMLIIEESAGYQRLFKKAVEKGIERGRLEKLQELIMRQLLKKFKELPEQYLERVKAQDTVALEAIADSIFEISRPEDLDQYLS